MQFRGIPSHTVANGDGSNTQIGTPVANRGERGKVRKREKRGGKEMTHCQRLAMAHRGCRRAAEASKIPCPPLGNLIERDGEQEGGRVPKDGEGGKEGTRGLLGGHHGCQAVEKAPAKPLLWNKGDDPYSLEFFKILLTIVKLGMDVPASLWLGFFLKKISIKLGQSPLFHANGATCNIDVVQRPLHYLPSFSSPPPSLSLSQMMQSHDSPHSPPMAIVDVSATSTSLPSSLSSSISISFSLFHLGSFLLFCISLRQPSTIWAVPSRTTS